jgi:hypothetical protein
MKSGSGEKYRYYMLALDIATLLQSTVPLLSISAQAFTPEQAQNPFLP